MLKKSLHMIPKLIPAYRQKLLDHSSVAIGVIAIKPMFFMDYDKAYWIDNNPMLYLKRFALRSGWFSGNHLHYQIDKTKGGFHLIQIMTNWRQAKLRIAQFIDKTHSKYEKDPHEMRLRVSKKWDFKTGRTTSRAPIIAYHCHPGQGDLKISDRTKKEYYFTLKQ